MKQSRGGAGGCRPGSHGAGGTSPGEPLEGEPGQLLAESWPEARPLREPRQPPAPAAGRGACGWASYSPGTAAVQTPRQPHWARCFPARPALASPHSPLRVEALGSQGMGALSCRNGRRGAGRRRARGRAGCGRPERTSLFGGRGVRTRLVLIRRPASIWGGQRAEAM